MSGWTNSNEEWGNTGWAAESAVPSSLFFDSDKRKEASDSAWLGRITDGCADAGFEASIRNLHRKPPFSWEASEYCDLALKSPRWQPQYIPRAHFDYLEINPPAGLTATLAPRAILPKKDKVSYFVNSKKRDGSAATYEAWSPNASLASHPGPLPYYGGDGPAARRPQGALLNGLMFADAGLGRLDPTKFPQCYDPLEPWLPFVVRSHDILQSQIPITRLLPEHAAPGQFVERHRGGKNLVQMGEVYVKNLRRRYEALVRVSEELENSNDAVYAYKGRRPEVPTSLFDGMTAGLIYAELWALVCTVRRQISLLQAYVTFGRFLPSAGLAREFNEAMSTPRGRELFLTPMAVADSHYMGCWLADAPSSYAYFLSTMRVPCYVFHRCLPGDLPAGASTFDGGRNYLRVAGVDKYVYTQPEVVNLPDLSFVPREEVPPRFYGARRPIQMEDTDRTLGSPRGQEGRLALFQKDHARILENVVLPTVRPSLSARPRPAPRSAARPLDVALYRPSTISLDPIRVEWYVPPPIAPMPEGKFAYYIETDPPRPTNFITIRNANQAEYQRIVDERGAYTVFCRHSRRAFRLYSTINYPAGCLQIEDFGFAVPEGSWRITSVMGSNARLETSPTWVYPYSPRAGTIGRKMRTPEANTLPLKIVGATMPFGGPPDEDDGEDYWEDEAFGPPSPAGKHQEGSESGQLKAPTTEGTSKINLPSEANKEDVAGSLATQNVEPNNRVPAGATTQSTRTVEAESEGTEVVRLGPESGASWLKFWPGPKGWERGAISMDEVVEGLHSFVQRNQGVFCTRSLLLADVGGFTQVYMQVDRPQEHAIIRGLLQHRQWPTIADSKLEVEDISKRTWDGSWNAALSQEKLAVTIVFKAPTFVSFCSLMRTHAQQTGEELDLTELGLSQAHLEMIGWPSKENPLSWKDAPGAGYMPVEWIPSQVVEEGYYLKHYNGRAHARGLRGGPRARRSRGHYGGDDDEPRKVAKLHERMGIHMTEPASLEERLQQGAPPLEERLSGSRATLQDRISEEDRERNMDTS